MDNNLKMLTGKNPKDFELVAYSLINNSDTVLFSQLVEKEDFLFDFVKQNVATRLKAACNESNYLNLLNFLKFYSPSYEEFIISTLAQFADDDLTDRMLEIFEFGSEDEKTYCAKFFSYIQDPLALDLLREYAWSENSALSRNCALTLASFNDEESYNKALGMLNSEDEFIKLDGVKFLCSYGNMDAIEPIVKVIKTSSMAENIAGELLYLTDFFSLYGSNKMDALLVLNSVINGLGEILSLGVVFDYELYNAFDMLMKETKTSESALVLYNAIDKFNTLTENDEYLFDEAKEIKQEVKDIKQLLETLNNEEMLSMLENELDENSYFVFTALEFARNPQRIRTLLTSKTPAIIVKALEVLKSKGCISDVDKQTALDMVADENLRRIILAM